MNKLNNLKGAKFRIMNDPELKKIIGSGDNGCTYNGATWCSGTCTYSYLLTDPFSGYPTGGFGLGEKNCTYGSFGCGCY